MSDARDPWPEHCRRELVSVVLEAAELFPHSGQDRAERIHDARKALKKARALVRLFVNCDDLTAYDVISALDKARRAIGQARNLDVMPAVLKSLAGEVDAGTTEQLIKAIAFEREVARIAHGDVDVLALATQLRGLARSIEAWDLRSITTATLLKVVRTTYRSARRLGRKAFADSVSGDLHDLI
jgi:CHAD domain-containing protein